MKRHLFNIINIKKLATGLAVAGICGVSMASHAASTSKPAPIQVMIVGAYHMGNPGLDLNNAKVDSVLTPEKQAQIAEATNRLAKFKPNKIAVEMVSKQADMTTSDYAKFTPESLKTDANEIAQIAYRLANQLGHKVVYAIDEQSKTIDYFPFDKVQEFAKSNNQTDKLAPGRDWGARVTAEFERDQKTKTVRQLLREINQPSRAKEEMDIFYYPLLAIGDKNTLVGAELNAAWYQRNAKIFAKLHQIAKPGDKILVVFGAGHNYWLRHFVKEMPGYQLVDVVSYLK
jgi:Family of unknown function (DUF5694)